MGRNTRGSRNVTAGGGEVTGDGVHSAQPAGEVHSRSKSKDMQM